MLQGESSCKAGVAERHAVNGSETAYRARRLVGW